MERPGPRDVLMLRFGQAFWVDHFLEELDRNDYVVVERGKVKRLQRAVDIALGVEDAEFISGDLRPGDLD
jgi:hypothetical protein